VTSWEAPRNRLGESAGVSGDAKSQFRIRGMQNADSGVIRFAFACGGPCEGVSGKQPFLELSLGQGSMVNGGTTSVQKAAQGSPVLR